MAAAGACAAYAGVVPSAQHDEGYGGRTHAHAPFVGGLGPFGAGLSSSTKVVATHVAVIVAFGSGLSLPFTSSPLILTIRVNFPTRSKKTARL